MTLTDTGPIVSLLDRRQPHHQQYAEVYRRVGSPLLTTWPCFTEAMYLLSELKGWSGAQKLWQFWDRKLLLIHEAKIAEHRRMKVLMEKYRDTPMDLADASLVAAAEHLGSSRIFTIDSDFYVYRINDREAFEVVP